MPPDFGYSVFHVIAVALVALPAAPRPHIFHFWYLLLFWECHLSGGEYRIKWRQISLPIADHAILPGELRPHHKVYLYKANVYMPIT